MIAIGDKLNETYRVVGRLGSGGFGEVFLAEDEAIPGRQVALKVLRKGSPAAHDDLVWEMCTLAQFSHPGIVVFHQHFTHANQLVVVMEHCAGGSLDARLQSVGPLSQNDVFRWATVLSDTLAFVHGHGIVHHDIKPANILFTRDGGIKLGDFGVANRAAGTRLYMPPEMLLGEAVSKTDPRIDVYALGLTVLEMLLGEHPFESFTPEQALRARIAHDFVPDTLPGWVQDVLLCATHPTPEQRFQTIAKFGEAITSQHVPYVFDGKRIKAHGLAVKSETQLKRKRWKAAEKLASQALRLAPDSAAALVAAGRCALRVRRTEQARDYFGHALDVNPRIHVQKELGWLHLESGHLPIAIALLSDHLDRNASDFEAYNLLMKCFFLSGRYEAADDLASLVIQERVDNACFRNNQFVCHLLNGAYPDEVLQGIDSSNLGNPFLIYNLTVARERPSSWAASGNPELRHKVVFQEFGFDLAGQPDKTNLLSVRLPDGSRQDIAAPLVSIGSIPANDVVLKDRSISRRHAVIVNLPNDVWLYDLGSTVGTRIGEDVVRDRAFLDGVHHVTIGRITIEIAARAGLLV